MTTPTQKINADKLMPGMHLCYRVAELISLGKRALFLRNDELVGEIILTTLMDDDDILVTLSYGRSLIVNKYEERDIEIVQGEAMVAHRGKATTFRGISIE